MLRKPCVATVRGISIRDPSRTQIQILPPRYLETLPRMHVRGRIPRSDSPRGLGVTLVAYKRPALFIDASRIVPVGVVVAVLDQGFSVL